MAVVGVANLAVKVADLDDAIAFYERAGAVCRDRQQWRGGERVDVVLGPLQITLFTRAIYEDEVALPESGFLHVALFTDDLDRELAGHDVVWGPDTVSGTFGTRRIAFVHAPGDMRLELMEQLEPPPPQSGDIAAALLELGAATVAESGGRVLPRRLGPVWPGAALAGPVYPVRCAPGDNLAVHAAVAAAPPGSILAVEVDDDREHGFWGEVLTVAAQHRGIAGLVIDACVRDTAALRSRRFPVFSTGVALPGATKHGPGSIGEPVRIGDQPIEPGDWLVGDGDGVVVIPRDELAAVVRRATERRDDEAQLFVALQAGATTIELLGLDARAIDGGGS